MKFPRVLIGLVAFAALSSCSTTMGRDATRLGQDVSVLAKLPVNGTYQNGIRVQPVSINVDPALTIQGENTSYPVGFGSGVEYLGIRDGRLLFAGVTDRGPNLDGPSTKVNGANLSTKFFPVPTFAPEEVTFTIDPANLQGETVSALVLKDAEGKPVTGLPLGAGMIGLTSEIALNLALHDVGTDKNGLDTESIRRSGDGKYYWISDEYGPFIVKVEASTGKIVQKFGPGTGLPEILAKRQANRGMEGLAIAPNGKLYGIIQSILDVDGKVKDSKAPFVRLVELDPASGALRQFAVPIDVEAYKRAKDAKIGDLVALNNDEFLLVEQGADKNKQMRNLLYKINIANATDINGLQPDNKEFEQIAASVDDLVKIGIHPAAKELVMDLRAYGWKVEKAEGLALIDPRHLLIVSDNDFGVVPEIYNPMAGPDGKPVTDPTEYELIDGKLALAGKIGNSAVIAAPNPEQAAYWIVSFDSSLF